MPFLPLHDDNPRRWIETPYVTWSVILFCVILFIWQVGLDPRREFQLLFAFGFVPGALFGDLTLAPQFSAIPTVATPATSIFLHAGAWHLIGNMLFLYIFGDGVEDGCGHVRFAAFFLVTGVIAALAHGLANPDSPAPLIGASGSISAVLAAYLAFRPTEKITAIMPFFVPLSMPVWAWVAGWFVYQAIAGGGLLGEDNVAYAAHFGGFAAGLLLIPLFKRREARLFRRRP